MLPNIFPAGTSSTGSKSLPINMYKSVIVAFKTCWSDFNVAKVLFSSILKF